MERFSRRSFLDQTTKLASGLLIAHTVPDFETQRQNTCEQFAYTGLEWFGRCSYYSHAGCVGCGPNQITRSGEPFDENAMTMAFKEAYLNRYCEVLNLRNGLSVIVKANDTGGFESKGILADLSLGVARAIQMPDHLADPIRISLLECIDPT